MTATLDTCTPYKAKVLHVVPVTKIISHIYFKVLAFTIVNNEKYALNPVFCKGEAAFSHLSGGGIFGKKNLLTRPP